MINKSDIAEPYWFEEGGLPGLDFSRQLVEPGTHDNYPCGALGIRADGDFWTVAALPWSWREIPLPAIVALLWPSYVAEATYEPDSGSVEQKIHFAYMRASDEKARADHQFDELCQVRAELDRLRAGRPDLHERHHTRRRATDDYFIRQYEHLLVAMAHHFVPRDDLAGVCSVCDLYGSDRVHQQVWIDHHNAGYPRDVKHLLDYDKD